MFEIIDESKTGIHIFQTEHEALHDRYLECLSRFAKNSEDIATINEFNVLHK
jgi:hypothetical protein